MDWVQGYYSTGKSIEVYVNLGNLDPREVAIQLARETGAPVEKFKVKENDEESSINLYG